MARLVGVRCGVGHSTLGQDMRKHRIRRDAKCQLKREERETKNNKSEATVGQDDGLSIYVAMGKLQLSVCGAEDSDLRETG